MGSFAVAAGWVALATGIFPRWLGRLGILSGLGMALARFTWTVEGLWLAPYAGFWLWVLITCVRLMRRTAR